MSSLSIKINKALQRIKCSGIESSITTTKVSVTIANQPSDVLTTKNTILGVIGEGWSVQKATVGFYSFHKAN